MRLVAVVPVMALEGDEPSLDPDAQALAAWLAAETARELNKSLVLESRLVLDEVDIEPGALGEAAAALETEACLGAALWLEGDALSLSYVLAGADGEVRASWEESLSLGGATQLPVRTALAVLLELGENAPDENVLPESSPEAVRRFVRGIARGLDGVRELMALSREEPSFEAPRQALLNAARENLGGDHMPIFLAALEQLLEERPGDFDLLLALGDYRALHFDVPGSRQLYLEARELAPDGPSEAAVLHRLASQAEEGGRADEAILHLRAAAKEADDAWAYSRLGTLLLPKDSAEGLTMLTRAAVLAPEDPRIHLELLRGLRAWGDDPQRAAEVAARTAELCAGTDLEDEAKAEVLALVGETPS